ncbi:unnamed protein product [Debaryomyces tyrocola]|nr:unnamed protein product [Debaryomyces tyrocola]
MNIIKDGGEIPLLIEKHEKYFRLCMQSLPSKAQSEDSNRLSLIYFCLHGLGILGKLNLTEAEKKAYATHVYAHQIIDPSRQIESFRSSQTFQLAVENGNYDLPNLSATFFALINLLALESDYSVKLNRHKIMKFVSKCQVTDGPNKGAFKPVLDKDGYPFGEVDLRYCYIAASIRKLCKYDELPVSERMNDFNEQDLAIFVLDRVNFNGGLSSNKFTESHSGLTFCGIATLRLLEYDFTKNIQWVETTKKWLVHRQIDYSSPVYKGQSYSYWIEEDIGSFNGRENKFGDTCYSWWCSASLKLLDPNGLQLINTEKAIEYLLGATQSPLLGGFGKDSESFPDPFHSFLGLSCLSLYKSCEKYNYEGEEILQEMDETLVITKKLREFLNSHIQF